MDSPELASPWRGQPDPDLYGPEAAARMKNLIQPGQYIRIVQDSNSKAAGVDIYGRQLGYVETLPKPFDQLLRIPYLGKVIPARDTGRTLIQEGLADIAYRQLSGRTDRAVSYDQARAQAQGEGIHVWTPEGRAALPWVGSEKTVAERQADAFRRATGGDLPTHTPAANALTPLALGLMTTGNTGIFRAMTGSGQGVAQLYNLAVAGAGAAEFNERAMRRYPRNAYQPNIPSIYDLERQRIMEERRARGN
jgi:hypothetical protein